MKIAEAQSISERARDLADAGDLAGALEILEQSPGFEQKPDLLSQAATLLRRLGDKRKSNIYMRRSSKHKRLAAERARDLESGGNLVEALHTLKQSPGFHFDPRLLFKAAALLQSLNDHTRADSYLKSGIQLLEQSSAYRHKHDLWFQASDLFRSRASPDQAEIYLEKGIQAKVYAQASKLAQDLVDARDLSRALDLLENVPGFNNDPALLFQAAKIIHLKNRNQAKAYLGKALTIDPSNCFCLQLAGDISFEQGYLDDARILYKRAYENNITAPHIPASKMVATLLKLSKPRDANKWANKFLKHSPDNPYALELKVKCFLNMRHRDSAHRWADRKLKIEPKSARAVELKLRCLDAFEGQNRVESWVEARLKERPNDAVTLLAAGFVALKSNDLEKAAEYTYTLLEGSFKPAHMYLAKALVLKNALPAQLYEQILSLCKPKYIQDNRFDLNVDPDNAFRDLARAIRAQSIEATPLSLRFTPAARPEPGENPARGEPRPDPDHPASHPE
jgi:tetratricopeptide (TPR) repeat protein